MTIPSIVELFSYTKNQMLQKQLKLFSGCGWILLSTLLNACIPIIEESIWHRNCNSFYVNRKLSIRQVHQQNGQAEQLNQTLLEKTQSMWLEACLPDSWWEFAFATATYVYNYTPIKHLKWKTPQEIFTGEKHKISHLHIFGYRAYVYLQWSLCK